MEVYGLEEKKAIERFKNFIYTYQDVIEDEYSDYEEKESAKEYQEVSEKILNLIEKQSKEIEELKEDKYGLEEEVQMQAKNIMLCEEALCEMQNKIKAKTEEVKDGTFDAKIVLQSLLEKE